MQVLVWFQSCAIVALILYAFYVRRRFVRSEEVRKKEEMNVKPDEEERAETFALSVDEQRGQEAEGVVPERSVAGNMSDRELFERLHRLIVDDKLFLDPNFSREHVMKLGLMNKNKAASLFRQFAHTNFNGYVNALRLEYALSLMHRQPRMPVKAVAYDSGFNSIRTFYRAFEKVYGKTPVEYMASLSVAFKEEEK